MGVTLQHNTADLNAAMQQVFVIKEKKGHPRAAHFS
jgi:hypothetical protein